MDSKIWIGLGIGIAVSAVIIIVIEAWKRVRDGGHLFLGGHRAQDKLVDFPHVAGLVDEDGYPGEPRGRVWTDLERSEYRQAKERRKLRIIQ